MCPTGHSHCSHGPKWIWKNNIARQALFCRRVLPLWEMSCWKYDDYRQGPKGRHVYHIHILYVMMLITWYTDFYVLQMIMDRLCDVHTFHWPHTHLTRNGRLLMFAEAQTILQRTETCLVRLFLTCHTNICEQDKYLHLTGMQSVNHGRSLWSLQYSKVIPICEIGDITNHVTGQEYPCTCIELDRSMIWKLRKWSPVSNNLPTSILSKLCT